MTVIFDADNHYYETEDAFTRFMPSSKMAEAVRLVDDHKGRRVLVGDRPYTYMEDPFSEMHAKPGALKEQLRTLKSGVPDYANPGMELRRQPIYQDRSARLELMDQQGVNSIVLFPTLGVSVEHFMKDDPERTYLNVHAFNRWLLEDWGYGTDGRLYGVPMLSLLDHDAAVGELEFLIANGARFIALRPGPQGGRSPADPAYDRFWSMVNEAQLTVAFHISESGFNELYSTHWGENPNPSDRTQSAFQWTSFFGDLPIMQTMASLVFYNFFGRYPNVRVMSVENGSLWVPYLLSAMDKMKGMGRNGPWPGGYVSGKPSEIMKTKVFVAPYHEENIPALVQLIGATQVLFGSDFPHPEGLADPHEFREGLSGLTDEQQDLIMGENCAALSRPSTTT